MSDVSSPIELGTVNGIGVIETHYGRNRLAAVGLTVALGIGGVACASTHEAQPRTDTTLPTLHFKEAVQMSASGMTPKGTESKFEIAGEGSCSPYNHDSALAIANHEIPAPTIDLVDAEVSFLNQHRSFANNYALTSESHTGFIYDALGIKRPSQVKADRAGGQKRKEFENSFYVTAPLAQNTEVQNTFCDTEGNLHDWRVVELEAGTYVGGILIKSQTGNKTTFANGKTVELPANALITTVKLANGKTAQMLAVNKAGFSTDKDFAAEVGCLNEITKPAPVPNVPISPQTTVPETTPTMLHPKHDNGGFIPTSPGGGGPQHTPAPTPPVVPDTGENPVGTTMVTTTTERKTKVTTTTTKDGGSGTVTTTTGGTPVTVPKG